MRSGELVLFGKILRLLEAMPREKYVIQKIIGKERKMKTSEKIDLISKALVAAQKEIRPAVRDSKNPYFRSSYADLTAVVDAIKEPLNRHGISFLQLVHSGDRDTVETVLLHESGQYISTETRIYCAKPNDPQAFGSGITYTKRYALQAALGLPTEDDDGNKAADKTDSHQEDRPEPAFRPTSEPAPQTPRSVKKSEKGLNAEQLEFCEKVKSALEEKSAGKKVNIQTVRALIESLAKTSKSGCVPTDADAETVNKTANILAIKHYRDLFGETE